MKVKNGYIIKNMTSGEILPILAELKTKLILIKEDIISEHIINSAIHYFDFKAIGFLNDTDNRSSIKHWQNLWMSESNKDEIPDNYNMALEAFFYPLGQDILIEVNCVNLRLLSRWKEICGFAEFSTGVETIDNVTDLESTKRSLMWERAVKQNPTEFSYQFTDSSIVFSNRKNYNPYLLSFSERLIFIENQLLYNFWESSIKQDEDNIRDFNIYKDTIEAADKRKEIREDLLIMMPTQVELVDLEK